MTKPDFYNDLDENSILIYALTQEEEPEEIVAFRRELYAGFMAEAWQTGVFTEEEFEQLRAELIRTSNEYFDACFDVFVGAAESYDAAFAAYEEAMDNFYIK